MKEQRQISPFIFSPVLRSTDSPGKKNEKQQPDIGLLSSYDIKVIGRVKTRESIENIHIQLITRNKP